MGCLWSLEHLLSAAVKEDCCLWSLKQSTTHAAEAMTTSSSAQSTSPSDALPAATAAAPAVAAVETTTQAEAVADIPADGVLQTGQPAPIRLDDDDDDDDDGMHLETPEGIGHNGDAAGNDTSKRARTENSAA